MIYSVILRNLTIISDFSEQDGDFPEVLLGVLKANKKQNDFYLISYMQYGFYFLHKDEFTFSCISNSSIDQEKVLLFLNTLKQSFFDIYNKEKNNFTYKIKSLMKDLMEQYRDNLANDKYTKIEHELKAIENEKFEMLQQVIEKDMCLDSLISKSENLKQTSVEMKFNVKKTLQKVKKSHFHYYMTGFLVISIITVYFFYKIFLMKW